jgi:hypothetical protein
VSLEGKRGLHQHSAVPIPGEVGDQNSERWKRPESMWAAASTFPLGLTREVEAQRNPNPGAAR